MKVAVIYLGRQGGGSIYAYEMCSALAKKGVNILAIISKQNEIIEKWDMLEDEFNINLLKIETYTNKLGFVLSLLNFKKFIRIKKVVKSFNPNMVFYPMVHPFLLTIRRLLNKYFNVYVMHDVIPHKGDRNVIVHFVNKQMALKSNKVIILSCSLLNHAIAQGIKENKISIIPHGSFTYKNIKSKKESENTILFFGRIEEYKGIDILLKAFIIIKDKVPNARLIIAGRGDINAYIENVIDIKKHYYFESIEIINRWIDENEIPIIFSRAEILAVPYVEASQSGVIPMAYGFKMPAVASKIGGIPEQVDDAVTGFLVEPGNSYDLADKIIYLLENKSILEKLGENAFLKAKKDMNWDECAEKLIKII